MITDTEKTHLAATDADDCEQSSCGQQTSQYLLSQITEDVECGRCRRTQRWRDIAAEEGIEE